MRALSDISAEILIGDLLDRGPDSKACIETYLHRRKTFGTTLLKGNHEQMLEDALANPESSRAWIAHGGRETLLSYGYDIAQHAEERSDLDQLPDRIREAIPVEHLSALQDLPPIIQMDDFVFVHAGLRPGRQIADQSTDDMLWIREPFLSTDYDFGALVVHGHSPVPKPERRPYRINIDTGAYMTGRLTCLAICGDLLSLL